MVDPDDCDWFLISLGNNRDMQGSHAILEIGNWKKGVGHQVLSGVHVHQTSITRVDHGDCGV